MIFLVGPSAFTPPPTIPPSIYEPSDRQGQDPAQRRRVQATGSGTADDRIGVLPLGPYQQYAKQRSTRYEAATQLRQDIEARIVDLVADAALAREPVAPASLKDLLTFLDSMAFSRRPAVFLLDNGNFRVVWKNVDNEQAAFQFHGDDTVHCVFFFKRMSSKLPLSRETLIELMPNLRQKYPSFARLLNDTNT
jgi:hypothetical protein